MESHLRGGFFCWGVLRHATSLERRATALACADRQDALSSQPNKAWDTAIIQRDSTMRADNSTAHMSSQFSTMPRSARASSHRSTANANAAMTAAINISAIALVMSCPGPVDGTGDEGAPAVEDTAGGLMEATEEDTSRTWQHTGKRQRPRNIRVYP